MIKKLHYYLKYEILGILILICMYAVCVVLCVW
jgi:hypothetical protein